MNQKLLLGMGILLTLSIGLAACGGEPGTTVDPAEMPSKEPNLNTVSVHDPSVFKDDDGTYYVFGTHYAVASSKDLITWTQLATDGQYNFLYGAESYHYAGNNTTWPKALEESVNSVKPIVTSSGTINSTWAPDVIKHNGKYYMYYSISEAFGSAKSVIGRVESNNVLGPYSNNVIIYQSSGNRSDPNAIDPTVFFDNDGKLWMVYGSAAGGIYLIELENGGSNFGLPKEEGKGINLWSGGTTNNVEGPYIFYNPTTKYYYLMTSYGALGSTYNMRVARCDKVDGPYVGIDGDAVDLVSGNDGGNRLAGNYQFEGETQKNYALGHNSVLYEDGKYFVICHVRVGIDSGHHVEVRQLYFTENGWPVLAANRYAGETAGSYETSLFEGDYDMVIHETENDVKKVKFVNSERVTLKGGEITMDGSKIGTYVQKSGYYIDLTVDGVTYEGVVVPAWCSYQKKSILSLSAASTEGGALWMNAAAQAAE